MKVLKFTYLSIKILLLPVVVALLIYFRAVIFQPNISQYVDDAQFFLEQRYDISIPVHVVENSADTLELNQQSENSDESIPDPSLTEGDVEKMLPASTKTDAELASGEKEPVADRQRVVEQEILIILNSDSGNKSVTENSVEEIKIDSKEAVEESVVVDAAAEPVDTSSDEVVAETELKTKQEVVEAKNKDIDPDIMEKLSDTVDIINRKVDMLFDINDLNKDTRISAVNSEDFAIIKKQKIKPEPTVNPAVTSSEKKPLNTRDMLLVARQTFWNGNPVDSEKLYLDLVDVQENNPNVYGELGNVYYSQGKWEQAGKAYYEAAIRLLDLKQTQQVNYLLRVIQGLDAESAEKLKMKISG